MSKSSEGLDKARRRYHDIRADLLLNIYMFGDELAKKYDYPHSQFDAICYYLFDKRGLKPEYVRSLSYEALDFLLSKERSGWTRPNKHKNVNFSFDEEYEATLAVLKSTANLDYITEVFGDYISELEGYSEIGREALEIYICRKFGYNPCDVAVWSYETIRKLLDPEITKWDKEISRPGASGTGRKPRSPRK